MVFDLMVVIGGLMMYIFGLLILCGVVDIMVLCVVVVLEGIVVLQKVVLNVWLFIVVIDEGFNEVVYIVFGFGDVGDCQFGLC